MVFRARKQEVQAGIDEQTGEIINVDLVKERQAREMQRAKRARTSTADDPAPEDRPKNKGFVQVYPKGFVTLKTLVETGQCVALVYITLVENLGGQGTVCAPQSVIASLTGYSERQVRRAIQQLESMGAIVSIKVGTSNIYAVDPEAFWNSYEENKRHAAFNTRTLADRDGMIRKRIQTLAIESKDLLRQAREQISQQPRLFRDED